VISFARQDQTVPAPAQLAKINTTQIAVQQIQTAQPDAQIIKHPMAAKPSAKTTVIAEVKPSKVPVVPPELKALATRQKPPVHKAVNRKPEKPIRLAALETISPVPSQRPYHVDIIKHPELAKTFNVEVVGTEVKAKPTQKITRKLTVASHKAKKPGLAKILRANGLKLTKAEDLLLRDNGNDYTLQVIGLSYEKSMLEFIRENHLQGDTHYAATKLHGKPWFILVYGVYKTRLEATKAIKELPVVLKKYKPWPRQLRYVKADIDRG